jgi:monofunctional biosynthetic peptidoglycan transglycosylase
MNTISSPTSFNFNQLQSDQIVVVNDTVMGGDSLSQYHINESTVSFNGNVSLKNNGGFASLRMIWPFEESLGFNKILLNLIGDGKTYQFRLRTDRAFDGATYVYEFQTKKDKLITVEMDVKQFIPSFRGRKLKNMPMLELKEVQQMGFLIANKQVGEFSLQLLSMKLEH